MFSGIKDSLSTASLILIVDGDTELCAAVEAAFAGERGAVVGAVEPDVLPLPETTCPVIVLIDAQGNEPDAFGRCRLYKAQPNVAVLMLIGSDEVVADALAAGADELLLCPLSAPLLKHRVNQLQQQITARQQMESQVQAQREFAEALRETTVTLTRSLDPQSVMMRILETVGRVVKHDSANIMLIDGDHAYVTFARGYPEETSEEVSTLRVPLSTSHLQQMVSTGLECVIDDTHADESWVTFLNFDWIRSYVGIPIRAHGQVIGFLNIDAVQPNAFTPSDVERLRAFADQAAIAIENAQLYAEVHRDATEMRTLHRATSFLFSTNLFTSNNLQELSQRIADAVIVEFRKGDCGVILLEPDGKQLRRLARAGSFAVRADQPLTIDGSGLVAEAMRTGKVLYAPDVRANPHYIANNPETRSELVVPLHGTQGVIGALDLQSASVDAFNKLEQQTLVMFADRVAVMIENTMLYNRVREYAEELEARVQSRTSELMRVKERTEAILNHSSDAILLIRANGAIQKTNRAFDEIFGYEPDQALGKSYTLFAHPECVEKLEAAFSEVVTGNRPARLEIVACRSGGADFDADVMLSPVHRQPGGVNSVVCSIRDITRHKQMEYELRVALQKERNLNEFRSRFVSRASHEFRTPLAVMLTASDLLKNYGERMTPQQRIEKMNRIQQEVKNLTKMLDDMLIVSGQHLSEEGQLNLVATDIELLTRDILSSVIGETGAQHNFDYKCLSDQTEVYVDPALVKRIVANLLTNAIKYSEPQSTIHFTVSASAARIMFRVADEGMGIPERDQAQLFEAFHRGEGVEHIGGAGLGLALVRQAVELHQGEVTFTSQEGVGSVFTVTLPHLSVRESQL